MSFCWGLVPAVFASEEERDNKEEKKRRTFLNLLFMPSFVLLEFPLYLSHTLFLFWLWFFYYFSCSSFFILSFDWEMAISPCIGPPFRSLFLHLLFLIYYFLIIFYVSNFSTLKKVSFSYHHVFSMERAV